MKNQIIILICWAAFLGAGCTSPSSLSSADDCSVAVAYANLIEDSEWTGQRTCAYRIDEVRRGALSPGEIVYVQFYKETVPSSGLPHRAILIIKPDKGFINFDSQWYIAIGRDAEKGILKDTPHNRDTVAATSSKRLSHTPRRARIPQRKALALAKAELERRGFPEHAGRIYGEPQRNSHSWTFHAADLTISEGIFIEIGDDGRVKYFSRRSRTR